MNKRLFLIEKLKKHIVVNTYYCDDMATQNQWDM